RSSRDGNAFLSKAGFPTLNSLSEPQRCLVRAISELSTNAEALGHETNVYSSTRYFPETLDLSAANGSKPRFLSGTTHTCLLRSSFASTGRNRMSYNA